MLFQGRGCSPWAAVLPSIQTLLVAGHVVETKDSAVDFGSPSREHVLGVGSTLLSES